MKDERNRAVKTRISVLQILIVVLVSAVSAASLYPIAEWWVVLVFAVLFGVGITIVFIPKIGTLPFSLLSFSVILPALLGHNIIGVGLEKKPDTALSIGQVVEQVPFSLILAVGMIVISGCLLLLFLHSMKIEFLQMEENRTSNEEAILMTEKRLVEMMRYLLSGIGIAAVLVIGLKLIQPVLAEPLEDYPWTIMVFGIPAIVVLGTLLYGLKYNNAKDIMDTK